MNRDLIFETICEVCGLDWQDGITQDQRGRVNAACKQLRDLYGEAEAAVPAMIRERAAAWAVVYPEIPPTPQALTGNWSTIINAAEQQKQRIRESANRKSANAHARSGCQTCGDDHWVIVGTDAKGGDLSAPCPDCNGSLDPSYWIQRQRVRLMTGEQAREHVE